MHSQVSVTLSRYLILVLPSCCWLAGVLSQCLTTYLRRRKRKELLNLDTLLRNFQFTFCILYTKLAGILTLQREMCNRRFN